MKKILAICCIICMPFISFAQLENFDLSKYKLPDILVREIDFNANLSKQFNAAGADGEMFSNYQRRAYNMDGSVAYYQYWNSEKYQGYLSLGFDSTIEGSRSINLDTVTSEKKNWTVYPYAISNNKWYFKNKWFFESGGSIATRYRYNSDVRKEWYSGLTIPIYIGKGRIEPVNDARLAIYILQDLQKNNLLLRIPDDSEIIRIAEKVSSLIIKEVLELG